MNHRLLTASVAAIAVAVISAGGLILAASDRGPEPARASASTAAGTGDVHGKVIERAAVKLGVSTDALGTAHEAAVLEVGVGKYDQMFESYVAAMVESGRLTGDEAATLREWYASRPASVGKLNPMPWMKNPGLRFGDFRAFGPMGQAGSDSDAVLEKIAAALGKDIDEVKAAFDEARAEVAKESRLAQVDAVLQKLVEDGRLAQAEADELRGWIALAPDYLTRLPFPGFFQGFETPLMPEMELPELRFNFGGGVPGLERRFEFRSDGPQWNFGGGEAMPFMFPKGFDFACELQGRLSDQDMAPFFRNMPFGHDGMDGFDWEPEDLQSLCGTLDAAPATPVDPGASADGDSRAAAIRA